MFLADHAQRPVRHPDRLADLWNVKRFFRVFLHHPAESAHDDRVLPLRRTARAIFTMAKATGHRFDHSLLKTPRGIGIGNNFWCLFGQTPGRRMQPAKFR